ncbi:MAG: proprotein convertase P-domain protein, partial [Verrucomicrobiota bacterium]|nr:proprotein convertase P-domain protein [Verrucomicrobiota bacterium]
MKKLLNLFAISLTFIAPSVWAGTYSFANTNVITINDNTIATPYPSGILVAGIPANEKIDKITVTFHNLSHTYPADIDILLLGPTGTNLILFSDAGGGHPISGETITLDDDAPDLLPQFGQIVSGIFKPANYPVVVDPFPAPAPAPSSATNLSVFKGTNPNGTWRLYVVDDQFQDSGGIAGGW